MEAKFVMLGILVKIAIYFVIEMPRTISAMRKGEELVWQTGITRTVINSVTTAKETMCVITKVVEFAYCIGTVRTAQNIATTALCVTNVMMKATGCV
jgi:hypothetical protein